MNLSKLYVAMSVCTGLILSACGGGSGSSGGSTPVTPPPPTNSAPTFTSATSFTFNENEVVSFNLTVNDADGDTITITDDAGGDGALFAVDITSGTVTATTTDGTFDFEDPLDVNADNVYEQNVTLSDGTVSVTETITVTITNVNEPPVCTPQIEPTVFEENFTGDFYTFEATDPEGDTGTFSGFSVSNSAGFSDYNDQFAFDETTATISVTDPFDFEGVTEGLSFQFQITYEAGSDAILCTANFALADIPGVVTSGIRLDNQPRSSGAVQLAMPLLDVDGGGRDDHFIEKTVFDANDILQPGGYVLYGETLADLLIARSNATLDISSLSPDQGVFISKPLPSPETASHTGEALAAASLSDIDGDGVRELLIGISMADSSMSSDDAIAYIVYGSVFSNRSVSTLDLTALTENQGLKITVPTSPNIAVDFESGFTSGDVDGDGLLDAIIVTQDENLDGHTYVIRGSGLQAQRSVSSTFSLSGQTTDLVVEMFEDNADALIQGGHRYPTVVGDILGDGIDEIVVSTDTGMLMLTSEAVADSITNGRQSYSDLVIRNLATTTDLDINISEPVFARKKIDLDRDSLSDLVYAHDQAFGEIGGVVYGSHLQNLITNSGSSFPRTIVQEAVEEFIGFPYIGTAVLGDLTGDGQAELAFGDASRIYVLTETAINPAISNYDIAAMAPGEGVVLTGIPEVSGLGRGLSSMSDITGDGLPELVILDPKSPSYYTYIVRSEDLSTALNDGTTEISIASLFANEN